MLWTKSCYAWPAMAAPNHFASQSSFLSAEGPLASHYNVFLSFRGPDTRHDFADGLYRELHGAGISCVFRDKEEIHGGEDINATLIEAISRSNISIPIISPRYAESKACLMELAHMSLCRKTKGQKVILIFYDVRPSILKGFPQALENKLGQSSRLAGIFYNCEETIKEWKAALSDLAECKEKYHILSKITNRSLQVSDSTRARSLSAKCKQKYHSLSKIINRCSSFDHCGPTMQDLDSTWTRPWTESVSEVVSDVKAHLRMGYLIVPDDLVGVDVHLREMMPKLGVVCRDGKAAELRGEEIRVVTITGIPGIGKTTLAKVVFNNIQHLFQACSFIENIQESLLFSHQLQSLQQQLISDLNKREYPKTNHHRCIKALSTMFKKTRVLIILDDVRDMNDIEGLAADCNWFGPGSRIILTSSTDLQEAGLVKEAQKHEVKVMDKDLALQLFRKHAYGQNRPKPFYEYELLAKKIINVVTGIPSAIEAVGSSLYGEDINKWQEMLAELEKSPAEPLYKSFEAIYNFLGNKLFGCKTQQIFLDIACFFVGIDKNVSEYMWRAHGFPVTTGIDRLRDMCWLKIKDNNELWMPDQLQNFGKETVKKEHENYWMRSRIWNQREAKLTLEENKGNGKVLALGIKYEDHDVNLTDENFRGLSNLVFLRLKKAVIKGNFKGLLSSLIWLDWQGCPTNKTKILCSLNLAKLVILDLSGSRVDHRWSGWKLIIEKAELLKVLKLTGCNELWESPDFRKGMNLERLILECCSKLANIHPSIQNLQKLKSLNLKSCELIGSLPDLNQLLDLEELLLDGISITEFHLQQGSMKKLKILSARGCKNLNSLPNSIGELESLTQLVLDGATEIERLPNSITSLEELQVLSLRGCNRIISLPEDIGNLKSLEMLELSETSITLIPSSIEKLENLKVLKMRRTYLTSFPENVTSLGKLEVMDLRDCPILQGEIPSEIKGLLSLCVLRLSSTEISSVPASITELFHLRYLELCECEKLQVHTIPQSIKEIVIRCPAGSHRDHGEFLQFGRPIP